jgi:hypothetical protein
MQPTPSSPSKAQPPASPLASPSGKLTPPVTSAATNDSVDAIPAPGIPRFFHPKSVANSEQVAAFTGTVRAAFEQHGGSASANQLHAVMPEICNCPGYAPCNSSSVVISSISCALGNMVTCRQLPSMWLYLLVGICVFLPLTILDFEAGQEPANEATSVNSLHPPLFAWNKNRSVVL